MFYRLLASIFFGFVSISALSQKLPEPFVNPSAGEITVSDLTWKSHQDLPEEIKKSRAYRAWLKDVWEEPPAWFANIDIDDNEKTREVLIASSLVGSGGRNFLLITKTKNSEWSQLATIFGAPIFMKSNSVGYADLQTYHRDGSDMWLYLFKYSNGKYKLYAKSLMPRAIATECFYQRWQRLNLALPRKTDRGCADLNDL